MADGTWTGTVGETIQVSLSLTNQTGTYTLASAVWNAPGLGSGNGTLTAPGASATVTASFNIPTTGKPAGVYTVSLTLTTIDGTIRTDTLTATLLSPVANAISNPDSSPVTVEDIKDVLVGLDEWFERAAMSRSRYDDTKIAQKIPQYIRKFERECQFRVNPVQCSCQPDGTFSTAGALSGMTLDTVTGTLPVIVEAPYPYFSDDAQAYFEVRLHQRPVQTVQRMRIMLDSQTVAYDVPGTWLRVEPKSGLLHLQAAPGTYLFGSGFLALGVLQASFGSQGCIPQSLAFDYIAGLPIGWQYVDEYSDIHSILCEYVALKVLNDISYTLDAGVRSTSQSDGMGLNQSLQYDRFESRKKELAQNVAEFQQIIRDQDTPILFSVL